MLIKLHVKPKKIKLNKKAIVKTHSQAFFCDFFCKIRYQRQKREIQINEINLFLNNIVEKKLNSLL